MRKILPTTRALALAFMTMFVPRLASALDMPADVSRFMGKILDNIVNPLVLLGFALVTFYLLYAIVQFIYQKGNVLKHEQLKQSLIWAVIGVAIMSSVYGILAFVASSLRNSGIEVQDLSQ